VTIDQWLLAATTQLSETGVGTARLDCLVLLEDCLNKNRAKLLAEPEQELTTEQIEWLGRRVVCRAQHEPLAYIRGKTEFYGRQFMVTPDVLEPRPESETIIDLLKKLPKKERLTVIDVGTGSGALGITAAIELHEVQVIGVDIDPSCLKVARKNADLHKTTIDLKVGDLLEGLQVSEGTTIIANLPYVPNNHSINQAATFEPKLAIFGGLDGLDLYKEMFKQIDVLSLKPLHVITEALPNQHIELAKIAQQHGYNLTLTDDFIQQFSL
jgi:release factor glutamine methyltransferase